MEQLLTVKDVMKRLQISRKTLFDLTKAGKINAVKIGSLVRFEPVEIESFIEKNKSRIEVEQD